MKIIGIGIDICKNQRMQKILNSTIKQRFLAKVLHPQELKTDVSAQYLASRWAVKEALVKSVSLKTLRFHEIKIENTEQGQPCVEFSGVTKERIIEKGVTQTMISISHEDEYSVAVVIAIGKL